MFVILGFNGHLIGGAAFFELFGYFFHGKSEDDELAAALCHSPSLCKCYAAVIATGAFPYE
jgi:hypothetical protein